jgi:hypothetical protein
MARSTGPVLAAGALTWASRTFFDNRGGFDFEESARIGVATGLGVGVMSLVERVNAPFAVGLAYVLLVTVLLVPLPGHRETPLTHALNLIGGT